MSSKQVSLEFIMLKWEIRCMTFTLSNSIQSMIGEVEWDTKKTLSQSKKEI